MIDFQPTYLYIKQHSITGKLYFGKTTELDPVKYPGSGTHWKRHYKVHGKEHIETLWYELFTEKEEIVKFALGCSELWDIVKSDDWLNLIPEDGLSGGVKGMIHTKETLDKLSKISSNRSPETLAKMSASQLGKKHGPRSPEIISKISIAQKGKKRGPMTKDHKDKIAESMKDRLVSIETCNKLSIALKGKPLSAKALESRSTRHVNPYKHKQVICPHCLKAGGSAGMKRYHFDNCKLMQEKLTIKGN